MSSTTRMTRPPQGGATRSRITRAPPIPPHVFGREMSASSSTLEKNESLEHYAWHRESDGETFWVALNADGSVVSGYYASERVAPGVVIAWHPCGELEQMSVDMRAGGWHAMGGEPVRWPRSTGDEA